jgi:hypothetical protein
VVGWVCAGWEVDDNKANGHKRGSLRLCQTKYQANSSAGNKMLKSALGWADSGLQAAEGQGE